MHIPDLLPNSKVIAEYGQFGDYFGGVWGTFVSIIALMVVFLTWHGARQTNRLDKLTSILVEMLKTHDSIASNGEHSFWSRQGSPAIFLREFAAIYRQTRMSVPSDDAWSVNDRIDIAYTFAFYGPNSQALHSLESYGYSNLKKVQNGISMLRLRRRSRFSDMFKGHQVSISHYMRNLYGMYTMIDEAEKISNKQKRDLAKIVRTKLSNYEQALLALNIISHLGAEWERTGLIEKYKPFTNIPEKFLNFDKSFNIKTRFPNVAFEFERVKGDMPSYRNFHFRRWGIIFVSRPK